MKGEEEKDRPVWVSEGKMLSACKGLFYLWGILCKPHGNHKNPEQKSETKKKGEIKRNIIENHQTKMADRNTRKKKQWGKRARRKQKIKRQY